MRQNTDFIVTDIANKHILVPVGKTAANFNAMITLNEMGRDIWNMLENDISAEEILKNVLAEYDFSEQQARADIDSFLEKLRENGCIKSL